MQALARLSSHVATISPATALYGHILVISGSFSTVASTVHNTVAAIPS